LFFNPNDLIFVGLVDLGFWGEWTGGKKLLALAFLPADRTLELLVKGALLGISVSSELTGPLPVYFFLFECRELVRAVSAGGRLKAPEPVSYDIGKFPVYIGLLRFYLKSALFF
jgi:hypothetical protein